MREIQHLETLAAKPSLLAFDGDVGAR